MTDIQRKATDYQLRTYLRRHSEMSCTPEGKFFIEMVVQAWNDGREIKKRDTEALRFFVDGRAQKIFDLIGCCIDPKTLFFEHHPNAHILNPEGDE